MQYSYFDGFPAKIINGSIYRVHNKEELFVGNDDGSIDWDTQLNAHAHHARMAIADYSNLAEKARIEYCIQLGTFSFKDACTEIALTQCKLSDSTRVEKKENRQLLYFLQDMKVKYNLDVVINTRIDL